MGAIPDSALLPGIALATPNAPGKINPGSKGLTVNLGQYGNRPQVSRRATSSPGGYLTPVTGRPSILADATAITTMFYTPDAHNGVPVMRAGQIETIAFDEAPVPLTGLSANTIYDLMVLDGRSTAKFGWAPAWQTSTAGAGARGAGVGTCEQTRVDGLLMNKYPLPLVTAAGTLSVGEKKATYLASIYIGSVAGQANFHRGYGQSRRWDAWNAYNRRTLFLKCGDPSVSWLYGTNTVRPSNNNAANCLDVFTGLDEEIIDVRTFQTISSAASGISTAKFGVGFNSTTVMSGTSGSATNTTNNYSNSSGEFLAPPSLGANRLTALETPNEAVIRGFFATEANMILSAMWRG